MKKGAIITIIFALLAISWWNDANGQTYVNITDTICNGDTYTGHDFNVTPADYGTYGYYYDTISGGGDILKCLKLLVGRTYSYTRRKAICEGNDFTEFGFHIINPPAGYYEYDTTYYTVLGCDSTYHLKLTVHPSYNTVYEDTICHGDSYNEHGFSFDTPDVGIHEDFRQYISWYECDSIISVKLHVGAIDTVEIWDTTCFNQGYHENGIDTSGIAVGDHTLPIYTTSSLGCDSTVFIYLHVKVSYNDSYTESICYGNSYTGHGFYFENPEVGVYDSIHSYQTAEGCDSITSLHLTVNPVYDSHFTDSIPYGQSYYEHGYFISNPPLGWTHDTHYEHTAAGCDSTTHLHLYVAQVYDYTIYDTICHGESYDSCNFHIVNPEPGLVIQQQVLQTTLGFDSIVNLHLSVGALYDIHIDDTICFGESYDQHGFYYENPDVGLYRDTAFLSSIYHCDSTVMFSLYVAPIYDTLFTDTVCDNESYQQHGFNLNYLTAGLRHDTLYLKTICGCDSLVCLNLMVNPTFDTLFSDTICYDDQPYQLHGFDLDSMSVGWNYDTQNLMTTLECDSTVRLRLYVAPVYNNEIFDTICEGEDYDENNFFFLQPELGDHSDSAFLQSYLGCDSTVRLWLHVSPEYDTLFTDTICEFDDYTEHGFNLTFVNPDGLHQEQKIYHTIDHCDSIINLDLYVIDAYDTIFYDTICHGEDYNDHGFDIIAPAVGTQEILHRFETGGECDSLIWLNLTVGEVYDFQLVETICYGDSYIQHGFTYENPEPGSYVDSIVYNTILGCDSTYKLMLTVSPVYDTLFTDTICDNDEYHQHGFHHYNPSAGVYHDTMWLQTGTECDSIVRLDLIVNPTFDTLFTDTICFGEEYNEHGFYHDNLPVGWKLDTAHYTTVLGCDSTVRLNLYLAPLLDTLITDVICLGEEYHLHGFDLDSLGLGWHTDTLHRQTVCGCDSLVTLELYVAPLFDTLFTDTVCDDEEYHLHGFHLYDLTAGLRHDTLRLESVFGCDSLVRLDLMVNPTFDTLFTDTICFGEEYNEHGFDHEDLPVGWKLDTAHYTTVLKCDSTIRLNLYVAPLLDTLITDVICLGEEYHLHGFHLDSLGLGWHTDTLHRHTVCGCDSLVTLELYVAPLYDTLFTDTVCDDEEYHLHGFHLYNLTAGLRHDTSYLQSVFGCDSLVRLDLMVNPTFDTLFTDTICFGEEYNEHGFYHDNLPVGWKLDTAHYTTVLGCDSSVRLQLYVAPLYDTLFTDTICHGEGYHEHGFYLDSLDVGWHTDTLPLFSHLGCDSTVALSLYVAPIYDTLFTDTVCDDEEYHLHGFDLYNLTAGLRHDTSYMKSVFGCDSLVRLDLMVNPTFDTLFTDTICFGEEYNEHGFYHDNLPVGWKLDTAHYTTVLECDSTVRLELYVAPLYDTLFTDTICHGEGYNDHGFYLDSLDVGWHTDTLPLFSHLGCDSTVALNLYVAPLFDTLFTDTVCDDEEYHLHGFDLYNLTAGLRHDTLRLKTTLDCDSIVRLDLMVNPTFDTLFTDTICFGEEYNEHGFYHDNLPVGWKLDTLPLLTIFGCDSTVRLELYVAPLYDTLFTDTICHGEGYNDHGFYLDSLDVGWHTDTLPLFSHLGCDSTVALNLYVAPLFDTLFTDSICYGESYNQHGFHLDSLPTGWHFDAQTLPTIFGCDSVVRLELYVAPLHDTLFIDTICLGESYNQHGFNLNNPPTGWNDETHVLPTMFGCDSVVRLELYVAPTYNILFRDTICFGESYHQHGFHLTEPEAGTYNEKQMLSTTIGCDSIVRLKLLVAPVYSYEVYDSICQGDYYTDYGLNYHATEPGMNYLDAAMESMFGCDSIYHVTLNVEYTFEDPEEIYGYKEIFVTTDLATGFYTYSIDTIPGCTKYQWSLRGTSWRLKPDFNTCQVQARTAGTATLKVTAKNRCGVAQQSLEITAKFVGTGVDENGDAIIAVYPNPCRTYVNIEGNDIEEVNLYSQTGVIVMTKKYDRESKVTLDLKGMTNSLYLLEVITSEGRFLQRISVTNN